MIFATYNESEYWIFWLIIGVYLVFLVVAGFRAKTKTHTFEDYMVAGRKIGPVLLGLSFGATYFSAVMIVGGGEFSYIWGLASIWIAVIDALVGVFIAFVLLGKRTSRMSAHYNSLTVSEMLGKRYKDEKLRKFTALITLIFETIYLVSIFMGLAILLQYAMPTINPNITYTIAVVLCGAITVLYLNVGGAHGTISTDVVESLIMLGGVICIFIFGMMAVGGLEGLITGLTTLGGATPTKYLIAPPGTNAMGWLGYILVTSFGVWGMPQMITRFFTASKNKSLRWGLFISVTWAVIVSILCWWNGAIGRVYYMTNPGAPATFDQIVPALMRDTLPAILAAIFIAAVTAASLTTGEKVIMIASSAFTRDFYQPWKKADDRKTMRLTKLLNVVVVVIAIWLALQKPDAVLALCMFAWAALAATTLVPYVYGLFWKGGTAKAALWTGLIALIVALFWKMAIKGFASPATGNPAWAVGLFPFPWLSGFANLPILPGVLMKDMHEFMVSQIVAIIIFPIISKLTKKTIDTKHVDEVFAAMKKPVKLAPERDAGAPTPAEKPA